VDEKLSQLMEQAQKGDKQAYKLLLQSIKPIILTFLKRRLRQEQIIEDICQDVLIKIHVYRHTFEPGKKFQPWMYTITRNTMLDYIKAQKRRDATFVNQDEWVTLSGEEGHAEAKMIFEKAFESLTEEQQEVIRLTKIEGHSIAEAAEKCNVSESAMKVRSHRAMKAIKKAME